MGMQKATKGNSIQAVRFEVFGGHKKKIRKREWFERIARHFKRNPEIEAFSYIGFCVASARRARALLVAPVVSHRAARDSA
jgi:hypothetical protein